MLILLVVGVLVLYVWLQFQAFANFLGVDTVVLIKASVITAGLLAAGGALHLKDVVEKVGFMWSTLALILWIAPIRMLLNSKAALQESFSLDADVEAVFWYNDWPFIGGGVVFFVVLMVISWRD